MTAEASADFALNLLNKNNDNKSFVFSPFSLGAALSIVHAGAVGKTQEEMTEVLLKGHNGDNVTAHYQNFIDNLHKSNGNDITIEVASKFFLDNSISLKPDYQKLVGDVFHASVENHDFSDADGASKIVNGFVDETTHSKITKIVEPDVFADALAVLINAVYFKGLWDKPFETRNTQEDDFHGVDGDRKEQFLRSFDGDALLNFQNEDVQVCGLKYKNHDYTMWFFLPKEGLPVQSWLQEVNGEKLVDLINNAYKGKANITIPKFKIESEISAKEQLSALGMSTVFSDHANLSGVSEVPLKVSDVIHKAVIEVNEEGAEAAAATALLFDVECLIIGEKKTENFTADRPFAYAIAHGSDIVFLGNYQ